MKSTETISKKYKALEKCHDKMEALTSQLEKMVEPYLDFGEDFSKGDFGIFHQAGDGFVLGYESDNTPFRLCLSIIEEKGKLTLDDYLSLRI